MKAEEHVRAGRVQEALDTLQAEVRSSPADAKLRAFLFQLLAVAGQWDRAATQLKVLADLDAQALMMARVYEQAVQAELLRQDILAGKTTPVIFGEPQPWMASLVHGNSRAAKGDYEAARKSLQEALDAAPPTPGTIDGKPCQWVADADLRFGPLLEALIDGKYFWVPFFRIRQVRIQPPKHLRDLIWLPAGFVWTNGGEAAGFIFVRYPGSEASGDGELCLARKTEWQDKTDGLAFGCGQRLLATENEDVPILDIRAIEFKEC